MITRRAAVAGLAATFASTTDVRPIKAMQLARWEGKSWVLFGEVITGVAT